MARMSEALRLPIRWAEPGAAAMDASATWPQVLELLNKTAATYGRSPCAEFGAADERIVTLCRTIHRGMREYALEGSVRIVRQKDAKDGGGKIKREICVRFDKQTRSIPGQIRNLQAALRSNCLYKIEAAYFGLTSQAWDCLRSGFQIACRRGDLKDFDGELEATATLIPIRMLSPALLKVVSPHALSVASRPGRRPAHLRDKALGIVLSVFAEVSGISSGAVRRGE